MASFALPLRLVAVLLFVLACHATVAPVSAVTMDEGQVQVMLQAAQQVGFSDWTAESLRGACEVFFAGVQSCNETGFITSLSITGGANGPAPPAFSGLVALKSMTLNYIVNGTLPSSWSTLTQLETLKIGDYVPSARLTGALPESWSAMTSLKSLDVVFADSFIKPVTLITSAPPSWLGKLESVMLTCAYWPNSGLPASIGATTTLKTLKLTRCVFKGNFPTGLLTNTLIQTLEMRFDGKSDFGAGTALPSDFSGMTSLTTLSISGCSFTGSFPTAYPANLDTLSLSYIPALTGTIPQVIVDHPTLTNFFLGGSMPSISGPLPGPSNPLTSKIIQYSVSDMGVTGTIPSSILGLSAYIYLNNLLKISGPFPTVTPASASSCRTTVLYASYLKLDGTQLPTGLLENCGSLTQATFVDSGLTGQIPDFTASASLIKIALNYNPLGGTIPTITFAQRAEIYIQYSDLTGVVPTFYLNTTAFSTIAFAGNKLDLCSNSAAVAATGFANGSNFQCDLVSQTPRECGCPAIWPSRCFTSRPMAASCNNLPPDTLQQPTTGSGSTDGPTADATSALPSIALIVSLLVTVASFM